MRETRLGDSWRVHAAVATVMLASLLATCVLHEVNPQDYLADILLRVQTHPASRINELLPQRWKGQFGSAAVDEAA